jgi:hypothetical protein
MTLVALILHHVDDIIWFLSYPMLLIQLAFNLHRIDDISWPLPKYIDEISWLETSPYWRH